MSAFGTKRTCLTSDQCPLIEYSGHCLSRSTWTPLRFLGSVAVLPPIVAPHVIASQSDALPGLQVRLSEWLVNTL